MQKSKLQFKIQKYLIVGLGNPGEEYENNRHNIGFLILDKIKKQFSIFPPATPSLLWRAGNFPARNAKLALAGRQFSIFFLKPQTFMNNSGAAVRKETDYHKIEPKDIYIVHDDLDLDFGTARVSFGSSSAGHNGVQSIIDELKTNKFWRVRVGIGRPLENVSPEKFVLQDFSSQEKKLLPKIIDQTARNMLTLVSDPKEETIKIVGANIVD